MARTAYLDTSIFLDMAGKNPKAKKRIRELLEELQDERVRLYTSIITVQEVSVAAFRLGAVPRDTYADINSFARIYTVTKEIALAAAKREAELKDLAESHERKGRAKRRESEEETLDRICENRRRKWDCFHIATAQLLDCSELYTTDVNLLKRPQQLGLKTLKALTPETPIKGIRGVLVDQVDSIEVK